MIHSTFEKVNIDKKFAFLKVFCYICHRKLRKECNLLEMSIG